MGCAVTVLVAGGGYVGLSTATGFARQGHRVDVVEIDAQRAAMLRDGALPFQERSLAGAFQQAVRCGSICVHESYADLPEVADFAFVCTSTPARGDGSLDTSQIMDAATMLVRACPSLTLVIRSTVNPGTTQQVEDAFSLHGDAVKVVANPEFLREGSGLQDFEAPTRIVVGGSDRDAVDSVARLYDFAAGVPVLCTDARTAELIKLCSNAALAVRVSMANEIAHLAEAHQADIELLLEGVGGDPRIGRDYLQPGIGFGGSCLPKDLGAFRAAAHQTGFTTPVFDGASLTNETVVGQLASRALEITGNIPRPRICIAGVGFKPGSDSLRSSQSVRLARVLLQRGVAVSLYDPLAEGNARREFGDNVAYCRELDSALSSSDLTIVLDRGLLDAGTVARSRALIIDALGRQLAPSHRAEEVDVHGGN
jgi:UDPglucose 6-dehydrogenase